MESITRQSFVRAGCEHRWKEGKSESAVESQGRNVQRLERKVGGHLQLECTVDCEDLEDVFVSGAVHVPQPRVPADVGGEVVEVHLLYIAVLSQLPGGRC